MTVKWLSKAPMPRKALKLVFPKASASHREGCRIIFFRFFKSEVGLAVFSGLVEAGKDLGILLQSSFAPVLSSTPSD